MEVEGVPHNPKGKVESTEQSKARNCCWSCEAPKEPPNAGVGSKQFQQPAAHNVDTGQTEENVFEGLEGFAQIVLPNILNFHDLFDKLSLDSRLVRLFLQFSLQGDLKVLSLLLDDV